LVPLWVLGGRTFPGACQRPDRLESRGDFQRFRWWAGGQLLLGHRKIESTVRYLGIEVDDALAIAEQADV